MGKSTQVSLMCFLWSEGTVLLNSYLHSVLHVIKPSSVAMITVFRKKTYPVFMVKIKIEVSFRQE